MKPNSIVRKAGSCTTGGAGRDPAPTVRLIGGYPAVPARVRVGEREVALFSVPDLEQLVDRGALLRGEAEPPYWAHLWPGARVLAQYVERWVDMRGRRVLELGCGLGLPGLVAALGGARVVFVDQVAAALRFVAASAATNRLQCACLCADLHSLVASARFDCVLAAEVAYDRERFRELAEAVLRHVAPGGMVLMSDGYRVDSRALYRELGALGRAVHTLDLKVVEEGRPAPVRIVMVGGGPLPDPGGGVLG